MIIENGYNGNLTKLMSRLNTNSSRNHTPIYDNTELLVKQFTIYQLAVINIQCYILIHKQYIINIDVVQRILKLVKYAYQCP